MISVFRKTLYSKPESSDWRTTMSSSALYVLDLKGKVIFCCCLSVLFSLQVSVLLLFLCASPSFALQVSFTFTTLPNLFGVVFSPKFCVRSI